MLREEAFSIIEQLTPLVERESRFRSPAPGWFIPDATAVFDINPDYVRQANDRLAQD